MPDFDEGRHPRGSDPKNSGRFAAVRRSDPDVSLPAPGQPWGAGRQKILELLEIGRLTRVPPDRALALRIMEQAAEFLASAKANLEDRRPIASFAAAYDASRQAFSAMLENQGLRATGANGHLTVEDAIGAQLGDEVGRRFRALRILRNATQYPEPERGPADAEDAQSAIAFAEKMLPAVAQLIDQMGAFR